MAYSHVFHNHALEFEDADALLKRDWSTSVEDIDEFLWSIRQDVFEDVVKHRTEYPKRVQNLLSWYEYDGTYPVKKILDLTDKEMNVILSETDEARNRREQEEFERYVPPPRPRNIFDTRMDQMRAKLDEYKRGRVSQDKLRTLENELEECVRQVDQENHYWKEIQWVNAKLVTVKHTWS